MAFWTGWALWQKLSFVLAGLVIIVLIGSFCVLAHNKRALKKHAAAEARSHAEQSGEAYPMLTDHAEVPFGARALLKGIHVEGIWAPNCDSPASRDGTDKQGTYSAGEVQLPPQSVTAAQHTPYTGRHTRALSAATTHIQRPDTPDFENIPEDQPLKLEMGEDSRSRRQVTVDSNRPLSAWAGRRSSWILRPFEASKKSSRHEGRSRTPSEQFRRQMSVLFDDNFQMHPPETLRLNPVHYELMEHQEPEALQFMQRQTGRLKKNRIQHANTFN